MDRSDWLTFGFMLAATISGLSITAWLFFIHRDYDFVTEIPCDPAVSVCFERACEEEGCVEEPEHYSIVRIRADDYESCTSESCAEECAQGSVECTLQKCDETAGDVCAFSPSPSSPVEPVEE